MDVIKKGLIYYLLVASQEKYAHRLGTMALQ